MIDPSSNAIYLDAATLRGTPRAHELHGLDITTGAERPFSPVIITASVPGTGFGSTAGILAFDPRAQRQRAALLLDNGTIYIGFGNYCDAAFNAHGHGWLFAYNASNFMQKGVFVSTPNAYGAGIWRAGH